MLIMIVVAAVLAVVVVVEEEELLVVLAVIIVAAYVVVEVVVVIVVVVVVEKVEIGVVIILNLFMAKYPESVDFTLKNCYGIYPFKDIMIVSRERKNDTEGDSASSAATFLLYE